MYNPNVSVVSYLTKGVVTISDICTRSGAAWKYQFLKWLTDPFYALNVMNNDNSYLYHTSQSPIFPARPCVASHANLCFHYFAEEETEFHRDEVTCP